MSSNVSRHNPTRMKNQHRNRPKTFKAWKTHHENRRQRATYIEHTYPPLPKSTPEHRRTERGSPLQCTASPHSRPRFVRVRAPQFQNDHSGKRHIRHFVGRRRHLWFCDRATQGDTAESCFRTKT